MQAPQFRRVLRALGLSQAALARRLEVDVRTVNRWARGKSPVPTSIALLLDCWKGDGVTS